MAVADVGRRLALAAGDQPLDPKLRPPLRVTGVLGKIDGGLRLRVARVEPLAFPKPVHLAHARDLVDDPRRWAGRYVEIEDDYSFGFEASLLDGGVWLDAYPDATTICPLVMHGAPGAAMTTLRVRVVGFAHTAGHYGHLNMASAEVVATRVAYLDPARPACR